MCRGALRICTVASMWCIVGVLSVFMLPFLLEQKEIEPVSELSFEGDHDYRKERAKDEDE